MHLQLPPRTFDSEPPPPDSGASAAHEPNAAHAANASKVLAFGLTFDSVDPIRFGPGPYSTPSDGALVLALGADFRAIRLISCARVHLDSFDSEAPGRGLGGACI